MRRGALAAALLLATPAPAAEPMVVANELGVILASEAHCGLTFDQAAIARYVETTVPEGDMSFPGLLDLMMNAAARKLPEQSASQKTAHCAQVKRAARKHGFTG